MQSMVYKTGIRQIFFANDVKIVVANEDELERLFKQFKEKEIQYNMMLSMEKPRQ